MTVAIFSKLTGLVATSAALASCNPTLFSAGGWLARTVSVGTA